MGNEGEREVEDVGTERRFRLVLAYDGTRYLGAQRQAEGPTIQSELERAAGELHGAPVRLDLAGRTDSGVHALGMVAAYTAQTQLRPEVVAKALNARLEPDLRVLRCEEAEAGFHPRFEAKGKRYRYRLWVDEQAHPLLRTTAWHQRLGLDAERIAQACRRLVGRKDFRAFQAAGSDVATTVRTLRRARLRRRGRLWRLDFEGDGFLRHQVRSMVGTLVEIGRGRMPPERIDELLASGRREAAGPTAPAHGLFLMKVLY